MAYPASAIANEFLDLSDHSGRHLTQIDIQKLVYLAHGWHVGITGNPLIEESFLAWKYGPVVRTLYDQFRQFGKDPITTKANEWEIDDENNFVLQPAKIDSGRREEDDLARAMVQAIWERYGKLSSFKLVELTHVPRGPWASAYHSGERYISSAAIRTYFQGIANRSQIA